MKTLNTLRTGLGLVLFLGLAACGRIPSEYRGKFVDQATGSTLELKSSSGKFSSTSGHSIENDAEGLELDSLKEGKAGIYLKNVPHQENEMEVFWLVPQMATRQEQAGLVWFTTEVIYTRVRTDLKSDVQVIQALHCTDGVLMIDLPTQTWEGGCPATAENMNFTRVSN